MDKAYKHPYLKVFLGLTIKLSFCFCHSLDVRRPPIFSRKRSRDRKKCLCRSCRFIVSPTRLQETMRSFCCSPTNGPHEYEGTQTDIFKINKADLYIFNGLTLDDAFTKGMLRNQTNAKLKTLNVGAMLLKADNPSPGKDEKGFIIVGKEPIKHDDHFHGA